MTYVLHSLTAGTYEDVQYSSEIDPYIYRKVHYKQPGDPVEVFDGAGKALGIVFMRFPNAEIMNTFGATMPDHIRVVLS